MNKSTLEHRRYLIRSMISTNEPTCLEPKTPTLFLVGRKVISCIIKLTSLIFFFFSRCGNGPPDWHGDSDEPSHSADCSHMLSVPVCVILFERHLRQTRILPLLGWASGNPAQHTSRSQHCQSLLRKQNAFPGKYASTLFLLIFYKIGLWREFKY